MTITEEEILKDKLNNLHAEEEIQKDKLNSLYGVMMSDEENKYIEKDFISIKELFETRYGNNNKR